MEVDKDESNSSSPILALRAILHDITRMSLVLILNIFTWLGFLYFI